MSEERTNATREEWINGSFFFGRNALIRKNANSPYRGICNRLSGLNLDINRSLLESPAKTKIRAIYPADIKPKIKDTFFLL
jgi:hypothetical protein